MPYNEIEIHPIVLDQIDPQPEEWVGLQVSMIGLAWGIPEKYLEYSRKTMKKTEKGAISAEKREGIVKREKERLVQLAAAHNAPADAVVAQTRGDVTIIYAREVDGDHNLYRRWEPGEETERILIGGDISPLLDIVIVKPQLVTMVKSDGTVVRGASEEVRDTLHAWMEDDVRGRYEAWLTSLGGPLEIEVQKRREDRANE